MLKKPLCPSCGKPPMSWRKKLFGISLKCRSCGEKLRHDFLWSLSTLLVFTLLAYWLIRFIVGQWAVIPILALACLVIIMTPLKHSAGKKSGQ